MNLRRAALSLLARREHSRRELAEKLARRFDADSIAALLDELTKNDLLSDSRFARAFVRGTGGKFGRAMLRQKLYLRGVSEDVVAAALAEIAEDECARAAAALSAKYGGAILTEEKSRARAGRFLCARGFAEDDVARALAMHNRRTTTP
ncbi:MAG: regulatory protein RecX [Gammaproteobacteria bacterium]